MPLDPGRCISPLLFTCCPLSSVPGHQAGHVQTLPVEVSLVLLMAYWTMSNMNPQHSLMRNSHAYLALRALSSMSLALPLLSSRIPRQQSACLWPSLQSTSTFFLRPESSTSLLGSPECMEHIPKLSELSPWNSPQQTVVEGAPSLPFHQNGGWNSTQQQLYPKKPFNNLLIKSSVLSKHIFSSG